MHLPGFFDGVSTPAEFVATFAANLTRSRSFFLVIGVWAASSDGDGVSIPGEFDSNPVFLLSDRGLGVSESFDSVFKRSIFEGCFGFDGVSTPTEFFATFAASLARTRFFCLVIGVWASCPRPAALFRVSRLRHEVTLSHTMLIITMLLYCLRVQILVTSVSQSVSTAELIWICESTRGACLVSERPVRTHIFGYCSQTKNVPKKCL